MKSLVGSVLIITTITISLANGQFGSRFFYNNRHGSTSNDEQNNEAVSSSMVEDTDTNLKLLEENHAIPLDFFKQMDNVTDISDFIDKFVEPESIDPKYGIQQNIGDSNVERAAGTKAQPAGCIPDSTVVSLDPLNASTDPSIFYFPKCTRVKRCNGCCPSPTLECQPVEVQTLTKTVYKLQYTIGKSKSSLKGQEHVLIDEHIKCKCDCRIKQKDCNSYQVYDPSQCKCNCTNYNARDKCLAEEEKIWDYDNCKCRCRESQQCTTGTYFDDHLCKCTELIGSNATTAVFDRKRFIIKAVPVETSNNTMYDRIAVYKHLQNLNL